MSEHDQDAEVMKETAGSVVCNEGDLLLYGVGMMIAVFKSQIYIHSLPNQSPAKTHTECD